MPMDQWVVGFLVGQFLGRVWSFNIYEGDAHISNIGSGDIGSEDSDFLVVGVNNAGMTVHILAS